MKNTKTQKDLFIDIETTGTVHLCHGIIQIAAIAVIDGKEKGMFNEKCRPFKADYVDPIALQVQNVTEEEVRTWQAPKKTYRQFIAFLGEFIDKFDTKDKFTLHGYKVDFDVDFLTEFFKKNNDPYFGSWQNYRPVCSLSLMRLLCRLGDPLLNTLPNLKLETVAKALEIEHTNPHDALSDVKTARRVDHKGKIRLRKLLV